MKKTGKTFKLTRDEVYNIIDSERRYQDRIWNEETTTSGGQHSPEEWFMYIEDYVNEAKHILSRKSVDKAYPQAMEIMRKVAGMAVCAGEQLGMKSREDINDEEPDEDDELEDEEDVVFRELDWEDLENMSEDVNKSLNLEDIYRKELEDDEDDEDLELIFRK